MKWGTDGPFLRESVVTLRVHRAVGAPECSDVPAGIGNALDFPSGDASGRGPEGISGLGVSASRPMWPLARPPHARRHSDQARVFVAVAEGQGGAPSRRVVTRSAVDESRCAAGPA